MNVKELQSIITEYGKVKSITVIHYRNGEQKTEQRDAMKEMEVQRAITEINRYKGWKAEK